jgi:hypothetical protein
MLKKPSEFYEFLGYDDLYKGLEQGLTLNFRLSDP